MKMETKSVDGYTVTASVASTATLTICRIVILDVGELIRYFIEE